MVTFSIAVGSFLGFIVAYHTYGKWLARKVFGLDDAAVVPSRQMYDGVDYVPARREVIFGHHFTSIAGTGPIVGPAIAVFWGWLPALLWVVFGSIFIGAVHDFGAMVVSLRNRGQTIGDVAGRMISSRARLLFLAILFVSLTIVLAIFGLVIAQIFSLYPESVLSVWIEMPFAVFMGWWVYKRGGGIWISSLVILALLYISVGIGAYWLPLDLADLAGISRSGLKNGQPVYLNAVVVWTGVLFVYCFVASVLPVWVLLQSRDFINSHKLLLALLLIVIGFSVACFTGQADLSSATPAIAEKRLIPSDAPPLWPFLFVTIACGAISGFHCLVGSGTTSKQLACESDAQLVGYGAMLLEGALAVLVIMACCAGVGMGGFERVAAENPAGYDYREKIEADGSHITGFAAWSARYHAGARSGEAGSWAAFGKLGNLVGAFIEGSANFLYQIGVPLKFGIGMIAVLVASFAATTLDTATRLQRYVIQELAGSLRIKPFTNKYLATGFALLLAGSLAVMSGPGGPGTGGLFLWPVFGATNQLLAGLAFLVVVFYLRRKSKPNWFVLLPMLLMVIMPAWAMWYQMLYDWKGNWLLFGFGLGIQGLQLWVLLEGLLIWKGAKGVYPEWEAQVAQIKS